MPSLTSYGQNKITIDVKNIPMDYSVSGVNTAISPSKWSGACISFDVLKVQAVTGSLYSQKEGKKVPLEYMDVIMRAGERDINFPTGKGGEFYVENILSPSSQPDAEDNLSCRAIAERRKSGGKYIPPGTYPAWVEFDGNKCEFAIGFPASEDVITDIGEVQCN